jgi:hypothetical protein
MRPAFRVTLPSDGAYRPRGALATQPISGAISLIDMLKRYAFSFYEVVTRLQQLRVEAQTLKSTTSKAYNHTLDNMTTALTEMRAECHKLDLNSTIDLISHIESEVRLKEKDYTYADMSNHLDTLSVLFSRELQKPICFRIDNEKDKYFQKDGLFGLEVDNAFQSCVGEIQSAGTCYALE